MLARHVVGRRVLGPLVGHFDALPRVGRFGRCLASEAEPGSSAGRATSAGRAYLARNAEREGVRTTATGLQYRVLRSGAADAAQPTAASSCECHYRGRFPDGVEFDSSYERLGAPALLSKAGEQLPGWSEALLLMREGDACGTFLSLLATRTETCKRALMRSGDDFDGVVGEPEMRRVSRAEGGG